MARTKKTRKVGLIGVRKDPDFKPGQNKDAKKQKPKKHKGKPAGNRHNVEQKSSGSSSPRKTQDPRIGSKKPIDLTPPSSSPVAKTQARKYANPAEELAALEADTRLAALLDKLDEGEKVTRAEQAYVDEKMARHRIVCDLLGIADIDDDEEQADDDPLDNLDAIDIDDYKR